MLGLSALWILSPITFSAIWALCKFRSDTASGNKVSFVFVALGLAVAVFVFLLLSVPVFRDISIGSDWFITVIAVSYFVAWPLLVAGILRLKFMRQRVALRGSAVGCAFLGLSWLLLSLLRLNAKMSTNGSFPPIQDHWNGIPVLESGCVVFLVGLVIGVVSVAMGNQQERIVAWNGIGLHLASGFLAEAFGDPLSWLFVSGVFSLPAAMLVSFAFALMRTSNRKMIVAT